MNDGHHQRRDREHQQRGTDPDEVGHLHEARTVQLPPFQIRRAQRVADENPAAAGQAVAQAAYQFDHGGGDGIGRRRVLIDMSHKSAVRGKAHAPEQPRAKQGQHAAEEIPGQNGVPVEEAGIVRTDIVFPEGQRHRPDQLGRPGGQRRGRRAPDAHGFARQPEDQHGVQHDVDDHGGGADNRGIPGVIADFQQAEVALGKAGQQIGPGGDSQVFRRDPVQFRIVREGPHHDFRKEFACGEKKNGRQAAQTQRDGENPVHRVLVPFSPVLSSENHQRRHDG